MGNTIFCCLLLQNTIWGAYFSQGKNAGIKTVDPNNLKKISATLCPNYTLFHALPSPKFAFPLIMHQGEYIHCDSFDLISHKKYHNKKCVFLNYPLSFFDKAEEKIQ